MIAQTSSKIEKNFIFPLKHRRDQDFWATFPINLHSSSKTTNSLLDYPALKSQLSLLFSTPPKNKVTELVLGTFQNRVGGGWGWKNLACRLPTFARFYLWLMLSLAPLKFRFLLLEDFIFIFQCDFNARRSPRLENVNSRGDGGVERCKLATIKF